MGTALPDSDLFIQIQHTHFRTDLPLCETNVENEEDTDFINLGVAHQVVLEHLFGKPHEGNLQTRGRARL